MIMHTHVEKHCLPSRSPSFSKDVCILIPAFNPDEHLPQLIDHLIASGCSNIIVVNDGSTAACNPIFSRIEKLDQCRVLTHAVNLGKGRALKTGLNYYLLHFPDSAGVVTADADGQHMHRDILKVVRSLQNNGDKLVLGSRSFDKHVPLRSLIGNVITKSLFSFLVGIRITDTQTGLRGIPRKYVPVFLQLEGERYEFEMNVLLAAKAHAIGLNEEEISTVYIQNNRSSHFNPLIDSMKIYFLLIRFSFSSLFASSMDLAVFALSYNFILKNIFYSLIAGRIVASVINFVVSKRLVFHNDDNIFRALVKYYVLTAAIMVASYSMISAMVHQLGLSVVVSKILAESLLFAASFSIQRDFIFPNSESLTNNR